VEYNILSHKKNETSAKIKQSAITNDLVNRKKNLTEILDIGMAYANKYEDNYQRYIVDDGNYFRKNLGVFTNIIDSANRNGNIIKPFGNNKIKPEKVSKKEIHSPRDRKK
jgi:hypothetical protein